MTMPRNLLPEPPPTLLPEDPEPAEALASARRDGTDLTEVARQFPAYPAVWGRLAEQAYRRGEVIVAYAFARTGYHRGLDLLRKSGWRGHGPVPWAHEPNRGFLRSLHALGRAAAAIGEADEAARCAQFLRDCDQAAADAID